MCNEWGKLGCSKMSFKCEVCGSIFPHSTNLRMHMRMHTGEKPFKCEQCGLAFSQVGNLKRHLVYHSGVKPFKCEICGSAFAENGSLKRHLTTHMSRDKTFKCDECGDTFLHMSNWKIHMQRGHSGPFKWRDGSIRLLLNLVGNKKAYRPLQHKKKRALWESIADAMTEKGFELNREAVSKKWTNLVTMHKRLTDRCDKTGIESITWPYYGIIDDILRDVTTVDPAVVQRVCPEENEGAFAWSSASVRLLLTLVEDKKAYVPIKKRKKKRQMWQSISAAMAEKGYNPHWEQVSKKWANLVDSHKRITDRQNKSSGDSSNWPYYAIVDKLLKSRSDVQSKTRLMMRSNKPHTMVQRTVSESSDPSDNGSDDSDSDASNSCNSTSSSTQDVTPKVTQFCDGEPEQKKSKLAKPTLSSASDRFLEYCERKEKSEKEWREEFRTMMAENTSSVQNLTNVISGLIKSQNT